MNLREQFKQETRTNWENSKGEPNIDFVEWLERHIAFYESILLSKNVEGDVRPLDRYNEVKQMGSEANSLIENEANPKMYSIKWLEKNK